MPQTKKRTEKARTRKIEYSFKNAKKLCNETCPKAYAKIMMNLGIAYKTLGEMENETENFQQSRINFQEALRYYTIIKEPFFYANTQLNYAYIAVDDSNKRYSYHEALSFMYDKDIYLQVEKASDMIFFNETD
jgi:hypothetical protein